MFDLGGEAVRGESFDGLDNLGMEDTPSLVEETVIGHLLRERMLKRVFEFRKEARLIEKLSRLQMGERPTKGLLRKLRDGLQQCEGDILANDRRSLQEGLFLNRESVHPGGENRLDRGWHLHGHECLHQAIGPQVAHQDLALHKGPDTLFQEERVPFRALDQRALERLKSEILSQESLEESYRADGR